MNKKNNLNGLYLIALVSVGIWMWGTNKSKEPYDYKINTNRVAPPPDLRLGTSTKKKNFKYNPKGVGANDSLEVLFDRSNPDYEHDPNNPDKMDDWHDFY